MVPPLGIIFIASGSAQKALHLNEIDKSQFREENRDVQKLKHPLLCVKIRYLAPTVLPLSFANCGICQAARQGRTAWPKTMTPGTINPRSQTTNCTVENQRREENVGGVGGFVKPNGDPNLLDSVCALCIYNKRQRTKRICRIDD